VKFSVVPESSDRFTATTAESGSSTPGLASAIAGSFHEVISPVNTRAMVSGVMLRVSMPGRLKTTAIGDTQSGSSRGSAP